MSRTYIGSGSSNYYQFFIDSIYQISVLCLKITTAFFFFNNSGDFCQKFSSFVWKSCSSATLLISTFPVSTAFLVWVNRKFLWSGWPCSNREYFRLSSWTSVGVPFSVINWEWFLSFNETWSIQYELWLIWSFDD